MAIEKDTTHDCPLTPLCRCQRLRHNSFLDFAYSVFGLLIHSNVPIPGVPPIDSSAFDPDISRQVRFHLDVLPYRDALLSPREQELAYVSSYTDESGAPVLHIWNAADKSFLRLAYSDGTQFWFDHSRRNVFAAWPGHLTLEKALSYLLGPVFGLLLRLRGVTCLHASAVAFGDRCVVFVGPEGAGKSTTAAAFAKRGYAVLSDDIVALEISSSGTSSDGGPAGARLAPQVANFRVQPAYPHLCLWPDSVQFLYGPEEQFPRLAPDWDKRKLVLGTAGTRSADRALPLAAIYLFAARATEDAPRVAAAPLKLSLLSLLANTYANNLLDAAMRAEEFSVLDRLISSVPVRLLTPHNDPAYIEELCNFIYNDFQALRCA